MHIENINIHLPPTPVGPDVLNAMERLMRTMGRADSPSSTSTAGAAAPTLPTPPAPGQVWPGQGGIYIATLPAQWGLPERHLILGEEEKEDITWGGSGTQTSGADSQTDGRSNTAALVATSTTHPAAEWAAKYTADGHTDFFLPSRFDLLACWLAAPQLFKKSGWHWSSSQGSARLAWAQCFESGSSGWNGKVNEFRARAVRLIQL